MDFNVCFKKGLDKLEIIAEEKLYLFFLKFKKIYTIFTCSKAFFFFFEEEDFTCSNII